MIGGPGFMGSEADLDGMIYGFENGSLPRAEWTHAAHLALCASYVLEGDRDGISPLDRLRANIPKYNVSQGGANTEDSGYHETLTCFWHQTIRDYIACLPTEFDRLEIIGEVVNRFINQRDLFAKFYNFDVVNSREARARWISPTTS